MTIVQVLGTSNGLLWQRVLAFQELSLPSLSAWFCPRSVQRRTCEEMATFLQPSCIIIIILAFFVLYAIHKTLNKTLSHKEPYSLSMQQVLSVMFTPVAVAWPGPFLSFFPSTKSRELQMIELDILELISNISTGRIELRDANDLRSLFQDKLHVYDIRVNAHIRSLWWLKTALWTSSQLILLLSSGKGAYISSSVYIGNMQEQAVDLDSVSYLNLKSTIHRIQSTLQQGASRDVDFTCLSDRVDLLTFEFLLCAIPFLPYVLDQKKGHKKTRKTTPLFISVQEIISLLSNRHTNIDNIQNISLQHATSLLATEKDLISNKMRRKAHIAKVGVQGWREDRFMLVWEAGLLGSGLLTRWRIKIVSTL